MRNEFMRYPHPHLLETIAFYVQKDHFDFNFYETHRMNHDDYHANQINYFTQIEKNILILNTKLIKK